MAFGSGGVAFVEDLTRDGAWMVYGACGTKTGCDVWRVPLTHKGNPEQLVSMAFLMGSRRFHLTNAGSPTNRRNRGDARSTCDHFRREPQSTRSRPTGGVT